MEETLLLDYYYGQESEQFTFYRIPKLLFTDDRFQKVSIEAKVLYGIMLDRMGLSMKNGWVDEQKRVYIIFTMENIMEFLHCGEQKANKLMKELENIGLLEKKRRGLGKPNYLYLKKFLVSSDCGEVKKYVDNNGNSVDNIVDNTVDMCEETVDTIAKESKSRFQNCENHRLMILIRIILKRMILSIHLIYLVKKVMRWIRWICRQK